MTEEMILRIATPEDLKTVVSIYRNAIEVMNKNNIDQWDHLYPNEEILHNDILNNHMYLYSIDNQIAAVFVLNQDCDEEYNNGAWQYKACSYYVIHRLCVNPVFQGKGIGRKTMLMIEKLLREKDIESIRLDAFSLNPVALGMYDKLGYKKVGEVTWRKGLFYLFEKKL
ncbi:MAG TPA: GNAT family N-acetyltransferase [Clostridia bacterium]|nr:GNAT family N-acetyltransferase [Clostridia bacterium]